MHCATVQTCMSVSVVVWCACSLKPRAECDISMYKRHLSVFYFYKKDNSEESANYIVVYRARSLIWCYLQQFLAGLWNLRAMAASFLHTCHALFPLMLSACFKLRKRTHSSQQLACGHSFSSHSHTLISEHRPSHGWFQWLPATCQQWVAPRNYTQDPPERERMGWRLSRCETLTLKLSKAVADSEAGSGRGGRGVDWNSQSCACGGLHQFPPRVCSLELLIFAI